MFLRALGRERFDLHNAIDHRVCCALEIQSALILEPCILLLVSLKNSSDLTIGHK